MSNLFSFALRSGRVQSVRSRGRMRAVASGAGRGAAFGVIARRLETARAGGAKAARGALPPSATPPAPARPDADRLKILAQLRRDSPTFEVNGSLLRAPLRWRTGKGKRCPSLPAKLLVLRTRIGT